MTIRKTIAFFLALLLVGSLVGCGNESAIDETTENNSSNMIVEDTELHANEDTMENVAPESVIGEPVDLGLSVKWSNINLGASVPEEYGGLYGWADPAGEKTSTDNADYPNENPPENISGTEYDIARAKWGEDWRLPTHEEQQELVDQCEWEELEVDGVNGFRVTGLNGNSIFLPGCGGRIGNETYFQVEGADYWSGDLDVANPDNAHVLTFYQGDYHTDALPRHYGFAVRPVTDLDIDGEMEDSAMEANQGTMENVDPKSAIAEPVDLGLSVKWANFNVGASKPEEYGGLYGWADPAGEKTSTDINEYPSENPPENISGTEYDIAHVQWGGTWRLPTREEQEELVEQCEWEKDTYNGVSGYTVTGPNGNSIFLPGVGGRIEDTTHYQVDGADYWSGTLGNDPDTAYYMYYYIGEEPTVSTLPRYYGFAVRAVCE